MKCKFKLIITIFIGVVVFGFFSLSAQAATFSLTPASSEIGVGEKTTVELRVDSEGVSFNAAQAVIRFPKDMFEVTALDKTDSAFSFWLEDPRFSNTEGVISFTGGTPYGVSGGAIGILKIEFRAKGAGSGTLSLTEAAITAADGSGTNILSKINDVVITAVPERTTPKTLEIKQIVREAVPSGKLPLRPILKIPLYPQENLWYNLVAQFTANWDLPLDISGISTTLNKYPNSIPPEKSEGLFNNKEFGELSDGTWYLHVRFQNNIGWGGTAHYKIAIDTRPPLGFKADILEGETADNPTPTLQFKTSDTLSGLKEYQIRVGGSDIVKISAEDFTGSFKLPPQAPGKKKIFIRAVDFAENSVEDSMDIEILPIASPTITFVTKELFPEDEQGLAVKGTALPDINVLIKVQKVLSKGGGEIAAEGVAHTDNKGNWEITFGNQPLRNGRYVVLAQSQDARGALSLIVESQKIQVKLKPIIQVGALELGAGGAALLLLLILVGGFAGGIWFYKKRQEKLALRVEFTKSEITKMFKLIAEDASRLSKSLETSTTSDDEYTIKNIQENIAKMESYLKRGVEKIKK